MTWVFASRFRSDCMALAVVKLFCAAPVRPRAAKGQQTQAMGAVRVLTGRQSHMQDARINAD